MEGITPDLKLRGETVAPLGITRAEVELHALGQADTRGWSVLLLLV